MADVVIIAPLVTFEGDDWKECREFVTADYGETTTTVLTPGLDLDSRVGSGTMFTDHHCTQHLLDNLNEVQTTTTMTPPRERLIDWNRSTTTTTKILCRCFGGSMAPRNHRGTASLRDTTITDHDAVSDNL